MKMLKDKNGITLVALAVTIVVILILAGVSVVIANESLIGRATKASKLNKEAYLKEQLEMASMSAKIETSQNVNIDFADAIKTELSGNKDIDVTDSSDTNAGEMGAIVKFKYEDSEYVAKISANEGVFISNSDFYANVKIGDYVNYPVEYDDIFTSKHYTYQNGWIVIDDGKVSGSGTVKIVSAGSPVKWYYDCTQYENNEQVVNMLINDFENLDVLPSSTSRDTVKANYFKNDNFATKVSSITLSDINYAYNKLNNQNRSLDSTEILKENNILFLKEPIVTYWLATPKSGSAQELYYFNDAEIFSDSDLRCGIRPVISLKAGLLGNYNDEVWTISN